MPPTVKLIELVIRGVETSIRPEEASVHPRLHSLMSEEQQSPEAPTGSVVSFLDKMSPDVAELHLTCVTLLQSVRDMLSCCWLLLEALFWKENRICPQIHLVKLMMGPKIMIPRSGQVSWQGA